MYSLKVKLTLPHNESFFPFSIQLKLITSFIKHMFSNMSSDPQKKNILLPSDVEIYIQNVYYLVVRVPLPWSE